jgi:endonuclease/exonuclease/phosphatase family metal-dependent hydrolase
MLILATLTACSRSPTDRIARCVRAPDIPRIEASKDGQELSTTLSVLIYNIEGLPWPARRNRGPLIDRIADELARMRARGASPDVVLLQEAFTKRGANIGLKAGYLNQVQGPLAGDAPTQSEATAGHAGGRQFWKGERSGKLLNAGLYVLSDYPVVAVHRRAFSKHACAGFDCLAAKGVLLVRVRVPGVPAPVDIMTTHMNSAGRAAGVPLERTLAAHRFQTLESARFIESARDPENPLILGGDFNMKRSPDRLAYFLTMKPYAIVRQWCTERPGACDVRMSWDGDAPWLDTQDLQAFDNGASVKLRPVRVEALFDGPDAGGKLSDHDAYLVNYRLSWAATGASRASPNVIPTCGMRTGE